MTLTDEERRFLRIIRTTPRQQLEETLDKLGLLESFLKAERGDEE